MSATGDAVECMGLWKAFGAVQALRATDLSLATGTLTAVLGPSGCGKTTLLRAIAGFERLDGGRIRVSGQAVAGPGLHMPPERRRVTIVPQEQALFPHLTVAENVGYGVKRGARRDKAVAAMLELAGLAGLGRRMPHELSGGQQQRVALARALAPEPSVVLLDERHDHEASPAGRDLARQQHQRARAPVAPAQQLVGPADARAHLLAAGGRRAQV